MREVRFIDKYATKWSLADKSLAEVSQTPLQKIRRDYTECADDLSYAQTFYPESEVATYLHSLVSRMHTYIFRSHPRTDNGFVRYWMNDLPGVLWQSRMLLVLSLSVFVLALTLGWHSAEANPEFVRKILGEQYVRTTIDNIQQGRPLAIYQSDLAVEMFVAITMNNLYVSALCFAVGIAFGIGPIVVLFTNGIMVGSFFRFLFLHGVGAEAILIVMVHGTLELSAIVVAGAAGMRLGAGFLFPGTDSRLVSFATGAKESFAILGGVAPVIIIAGFIEGFITRHQDNVLVVNVPIIVMSIGFIVWYFVYLPAVRGRVPARSAGSSRERYRILTTPG